jgi:hypothetical protein
MADAPWERKSDSRFAQAGRLWTHKAELTYTGFEFIATEHRGTDYVVPVPVYVVRKLLEEWDARQAARRERAADSGIPSDVDDTVRTLWRPVGPEELELVKQLAWRSFPPRLPEQPIFYPVCSEDYACEIAKQWNARNGKQGIVLEFDVDADFLSRYEVRLAGGTKRAEYQIPAEDLPAFNAAIVGEIRVLRVFDPV